MSETLAGFKAAHAGLPRDATQSVDWLAGYDGAAIGAAQNAATKTTLDAVKRSLPKTRIVKYIASSTPRSLDGSWGKR